MTSDVLETHIGWVVIIAAIVIPCAALVIAGLRDLLNATDQPPELSDYEKRERSAYDEQANASRSKRH